MKLRYRFRVKGKLGTIWDSEASMEKPIAHIYEDVIPRGTRKIARLLNLMESVFGEHPSKGGKR